MNIQFKNTSGGLTPKLQRRIEGKLTKLSRLTDTDEGTANAFFELERSVGSHQTGEVWQVTINIDAQGERFHTSELAELPEKASDIALNEIETEIKRVKGKKETLVRRGGRIAKSMLRRFRPAGA